MATETPVSTIIPVAIVRMDAKSLAKVHRTISRTLTKHCDVEWSADNAARAVMKALKLVTPKAGYHKKGGLMPRSMT